MSESLQPLSSPPISRMRIAYMAVAMRDPNPVHVDDDVAAEAGLPSAIAHGTFAMSYVGAAVTRSVGVDALRRLRVVLTAPVFPGDTLTTAVEIKATEDHPEGTLVSADLRATKGDGTVVARGEAAWLVR